MKLSSTVIIRLQIAAALMCPLIALIAGFTEHLTLMYCAGAWSVAFWIGGIFERELRKRWPQPPALIRVRFYMNEDIVFDKVLPGDADDGVRVVMRASDARGASFRVVPPNSN